MRLKHSILIIITLALIIISGCTQQEINKSTNSEEKITKDQCINDALLYKFGLGKESINVAYGECSTCSPWHQPQVARFDVILTDLYGRNYSVYYYDNCPRHGAQIYNYSITSNEKTDLYEKIKEKICSDFSNWYSYLYECQDVTDIDSYTSCINNYSYYIESDIINITEDWAYCSNDGWKDCDKWNDCSSTSSIICSPDYCKMSCLKVYSDRRIQNYFIDFCKKFDKTRDGKFMFSFNVPDDIKQIVPQNYKKQTI